MIVIEWCMHRKSRVIKHIKTGESPSTRSFWAGKFELIWILIRKKSFTQINYDRVSRDEIPDIRVLFSFTNIVVSVSSVDGIKQVLSNQTTDKADVSGDASQNPHFQKILGHSLVLQSGKKATQTRSIMNPAFKHKKLQSTVVPHFVESSKEMVDLLKERYQDGDAVQMEDWFKNLTYDIIGKTAFGHKFNSLQRPSKEVADLMTCFSGIIQPLVFIFGGIITTIPTSFQKKVAQSRNDCVKLITDVIENRKKNNMGEVNDLLDLILEADQEGKLTTDELVQNTFLLFLAGQETSAGSLTMSLYYLGIHQEFQKRAREEVESVCGSEEINSDHLENLNFLNSCINESLRINAPVDGVFLREATEDMVINDYFIPKGTKLAVNFANVHRSNKFWDKPNEYNPDRWLNDTKAISHLLAFSAGPRVCLGKKFAILEMKVVLATLLRNFYWTIPDYYEFKIQPFTLTFRPAGGLPVQFRRR